MNLHITEKELIELAREWAEKHLKPYHGKETYTVAIEEDGYLGTMILKDGQPFANAATGLDASVICEELNRLIKDSLTTQDQ